MLIPHPEGDTVHIVYSQLRTPLSVTLEDAYLSEIPIAIRAAILRYQRWQDRQASLLGKMLLLRYLRLHDARFSQDKLQNLQYTSMGKPFLSGGPAFNISHSGELIVMATARIGSVGIDVEQIRAVKLEEFRTHVPEVDSFRQSLVEEDSYSSFFHHWTQKEAVAKACGTGLLKPIQSISVNDGKAFFAGITWYVEKISLCEEGYCCHLAMDRPLSSLTLEKVPCTAL